MRKIVKVREVSSSVVVTIPKEMFDESNLILGDFVLIRYDSAADCFIITKESKNGSKERH